VLFGVKLFHELLLLTIPDWWRTFVADARITRLDVAVDLVGVRMTKIKMMPPLGQTSQAWWSTGGKLQTYQWGKAKGTHTQIYNKTAQLHTKGIVLPGPQVTRVERRLKSPVCKQLTKLGEMANPFSGILLTTSVPEAPPGGLITSGPVR
jgi:hypothetical protein